MKTKEKLRVCFVLVFGFLALNVNIFARTTLTTHITQKHTKKEIIEKYVDSVTYDYSNTEYDIAPSSQYPYVAGTLQQGVINDTLKRINLYRWISGLNNITLREDKMERNQKGAVVLDKNRVLTHTPEKPSDMDYDFYKEGYYGCYSKYVKGDRYTGNASWDYHVMPYVVDGYIDDVDIADKTYGAVGHRLSLLDPLATHTSFGKCGSYSTLSMYYELNIKDYKNNVEQMDYDIQNYYSYPTAGYFLRNLFLTQEYWSLYVCTGFSEANSDITVTFEYNGDKYTTKDIVIEQGNPAISFQMPYELIERLGGTNRYMPACDIKVTIEGVNNSQGKGYDYQYTVSFFDAGSYLQDFKFQKQENYMEAGEVTKLDLVYSPKTAIIESIIQWESSDPSVAIIDEDGVIDAFRPGTTTITAVIQGITRSCNLTVGGEMPYIKGDLNGDGTVNAADATRALEIFKNGNPTELELLIGDMDGRNGINAADATQILEIFKNSQINET